MSRRGEDTSNVGVRAHDSSLVRVAVATTAIVLGLLIGFLVWLAATEFNREGSELKVVGAALGLIGVVTVQSITLIGLLLKRSVDERTLSISRAAEDRLSLDSRRNAAMQRETESRLRLESERNAVLQREDHVINRVKAVREFFDFLSSPDPRQKESALVLIGELGDPQLAVRLSQIYESEGGLGALATLSRSADKQLASEATVAWAAISERLSRSVVRISIQGANEERFLMSGFATTSNLILTVGYEHGGAPRLDSVEIMTCDLTRSVATIVSRQPELTVLRMVSDLEVAPLQLGSTARLRIGDPLYILSFLQGAQTPTPSVGRLVGRAQNGELAISGFNTMGGSSGAPVVDGTGSVVGMHYRRVDDVLTQALPVEHLVNIFRLTMEDTGSEHSSVDPTAR